MQKGGRIDGSGKGSTSSRAPEGRQVSVTDQTPSVGEYAQVPGPCSVPARRYLHLLAGGDAAHSFQPYYDPDPNGPDTTWMRRFVHGHLDDVWPTLVARQSKGAAIAVTVAETDGRGRKNANMVRPRAVWIEADNGLPRALPLPPTITVETSPGRDHYIYLVRDLTWELWHGVQQTLIADYGSDPQAGGRNQVLRLPGTLHQKDPARPHLVRIVEELTSERIYTAAEIAAAFPPRPTSPSRRRDRVRSASAGPRRDGAKGGAGEEWQPDEILSALRAIDARVQETGAFTAQGDRRDDQAIEVDWSRRDWWLRALACLHHASGGSDAGFELSCAASGGESSLGLIGCPSKFDPADQRRVWESLTVGDLPELRGLPLTIRTIYWVAQRYCGWKSGRSGRPVGQPRPARDISDQAKAVAEAGAWAVAKGLDRVRELHAAIASQRVPKGSLMERILEDIRTRLGGATGIAAISSLAGMADTIGCAAETLRRYLRQLAAWRLIIKNQGNATSISGTAGITVALGFPEGLRDVIGPLPSSTTLDPPISAQTGIPIPLFHVEAGRNPSRSPYSHEDDGGRGSVEGGSPVLGGTLHGAAKSPDGAPLTLEDWMKVGIIHAEFGDLLQRRVDAHGKRAVSALLVRLEELRALRPSLGDVRCDAERAADLAARSLVRKEAKDQGLGEADLQRLLKQASPVSVPDEESLAFVRQMVRHLDSIIRESKGDPDPWRRTRRRGKGQAPVSQPKGNAYAAARAKRDPSEIEP